MATHSSILTWEISRTEETDGLQLVGSQIVRQDSVTEHACMMTLGIGQPWQTSLRGQSLR